MIEIIEQLRPQLEALCRKHRVQTLEVFGSAADGTWKAEVSDLDFLVNYFPVPEKEISPPYFAILEDLFGRKIDLVMERASRNPYFCEGVNRTRQLIYAA